MRPVTPAAFAWFVLATAAGAQQTYIVDCTSAPGTHFTDLPAALAVATHGDTIIVRSRFPSCAYTAGTVDQGIAIVGEGGDVVLSTMTQPMVIRDLPAGRTFRMAGFVSPRDHALRVHVRDCRGEVYFERLHADEQSFRPIPEPSFSVTDCRYVGFNNCGNFGLPSLQVLRSAVSVTRCYLGVTRIGIGYGDCVWADSSVLWVTEPLFRVATGAGAAIRMGNSHLILTGSSGSYLQGQSGAPAIEARGGRVVIDPNVPLNPFQPAPSAITGSAVVVTESVPGASARLTASGNALQATVVAPSGVAFAAMISRLRSPATTPFGTLHLDPRYTVVFAAGQMPAGGIFAQTLPLPASLPLGEALTLQGAALVSGLVKLTTASTCVLY